MLTRHRSTRFWVLIATLMVVVGCAAGLAAVDRARTRDMDGALVAQRVATMTETKEALGWRALAARRVTPQLRAKLRDCRTKIAAELRSLERSDIDVPAELYQAIAAYDRQVDELLLALAPAAAVRADAVEERVAALTLRAERGFERAQSLLAGLARRLDSRATKARRTAVGGAIALFGVGLALIALLAARWQRSRQALSASVEQREVLQASEDRFRVLIDDSSDMVTMVAPDGLVSSQSQACQRILGYESDQLEGVALTELLHPDDAPLVNTLLHETSADVPSTVEWRMRHRNGYWIDVETAVSDKLGDERVGALILTTRDVSERKALEEQLRHRAFHDPLTQLPNRALFLDRTEHALSRDGRFTHQAAVLFIDLDDFKLINDRLGHAQGDEALVVVSQRLRGCLRSADTAARLGGDEFGVLLESVDGSVEPMEVAQRILRALSAPVEIGGHKAVVRPSIGVVVGRCHHDSAPELLRRADIAMYAAKRRGKGRIELYAADVHATLDPAVASPTAPDEITFFMRTEDQRAEIAALLRDPEALSIVFQPIVDLRTGQVAGYEALTRIAMQPPRPPQAWFAQAHRCGLGVQLEVAAVTRALNAPGRPAGTYLALNVSPSAIAAMHRLVELPEDLHDIVIEVTENELVSHGDSLPAALAGLRARGAQIAVDDAGAGYAGLRQLTALEPDIIKLDRSIVEGISEDTSKLALIESFVRFSEQIGAAVCAEGIERLDDLRVLADIDVTHGQGYALGRPSEPWQPVLTPAARVLHTAMAEAMSHPLRGLSNSRDVDSSLAAVAAELSLVEEPGDTAPALAAMASVLRADEVSYSLLTPSRDALLTVATNRGPFPDEPLYPIAGFPLTSAAISDQRAFQVFLGDQDDPAELALLDDLGYEGMLMMPITTHGVTIGVLELYTRTRRPWSRRETTMARLFACQLGALGAELPAASSARAA